MAGATSGCQQPPLFLRKFNEAAGTAWFSRTNVRDGVGAAAQSRRAGGGPSAIDRKVREMRLYEVPPISTNMILAYPAKHVLDLPSCCS
jgi:hypothetical protein